jgi:hypothetical protein
MQETKPAPKSATELPRSGPLSVDELDKLMERLLASTDEKEILQVKKDLERGFYGDAADA